MDLKASKTRSLNQLAEGTKILNLAENEGKHLRLCDRGISDFVLVEL